jgi:hypothetical protein
LYALASLTGEHPLRVAEDDGGLWLQYGVCTASRGLSIVCVRGEKISHREATLLLTFWVYKAYNHRIGAPPAFGAMARLRRSSLTHVETGSDYRRGAKFRRLFGSAEEGILHPGLFDK